MIDFGWYWFNIKYHCYYKPFHWWHDTLPWWISMKIPHKIALFTFIRVYAVKGDCGPEYKLIYDLWEYKHGKRREVSISNSQR